LLIQKKKKTTRERSSVCGETTKDTAEKEKTSMSPMEKGIKVQQYAGHVSKRYSVRGERLKDKMGGSDICRE